MGRKERREADRDLVRNRKARHQYEILETLEAGIALVGSEVKSVRAGRVSLEEAFVRAKPDGLWLEKARIDEYDQASRLNHDPMRPRRLLVHRDEMRRLTQKVKEKGLTLVPLRMYLKGPRVKVEIALGKGRRTHDKREVLKRREAERDVRRALRGR